MSRKTFPANANNWPDWQQQRQENENWPSQPPQLNFSCPPPNFNCPPPYIRHSPRPVSPFDASQCQYSLLYQQNIEACPNLNPWQDPMQLSLKRTLQNARTETLGQYEDKEWIRAWLQKHRKGTERFEERKRNTSVMNISSARKLLANCTNCLTELKSLQQEMQNNSDCELEKWEEMVNRANANKNLLLSLMSKIEDNQWTVSLKMMLSKRTEKRKRQQIQKLNHRKSHAFVSASKQARHMQIDAWRQQQQQQVERIKREADTRQEADAVLGEVRHKQIEGRRWQNLLQALSKLRQLRANVASDRGLHPTQSENDRFKKVTDQLAELWSTQLQEYSAEEHALRVMLEEEAEVRGHQVNVPKSSTPLAQWENLLFGPAANISSKEFQYHTRANSDLQSFINIRRDWDQFLAPVWAILSSAPPVGWVVPTAASSNEWASLLNVSPSN